MEKMNEWNILVDQLLKGSQFHNGLKEIGLNAEI